MFSSVNSICLLDSGKCTTGLESLGQEASNDFRSDYHLIGPAPQSNNIVSFQIKASVKVFYKALMAIQKLLATSDSEKQTLNTWEQFGLNGHYNIKLYFEAGP